MPKELLEFTLDNNIFKKEQYKSITCEKFDFKEETYILRNVLSIEECDLIIKTLYQTSDAMSNSAYFSKDHGLRVRRLSDNLSSILTERVQPFLPKQLMRPPVVIENDDTPKLIEWNFKNISKEFKFIKYNKGQKFPAHTDGEHRVSNSEISFLSIIFYLNNGGEDRFRGGDFRFLQKEGIGKYTPIKTIVPEAGTVLIFPHFTWHDSTPIEDDGIKFVIRSNLMFEH